MWFDFSSGHSGLHLSGNVGGRMVGRLCRLSWVRFPEAGGGKQEGGGRRGKGKQPSRAWGALEY